MVEVVRLSFSIEGDLEEKLEELIARSGCANRSEFIRDMIRDRLVEKQWGDDEVVVGTMTLVYDHQARGLQSKLTELQHANHHAILAATHVHLDHDLCAEMILVHGRAGVVRGIANRLRQEKGVLHGALTMSSTGRGLS